MRRLLSPTVLAPLAVVVVVLVQFRPVLAGGVYRFEDIADYFEPLWSAAARAMGAGRLPIWSEGAWSGMSLLADPQVGAFYPPNWLWLALPILRAYAVSAVLHAAWAGLGMYALARLRGRSPAAAALAGIALGAGGFVVLQVRHIMFVQATAWIPWVVATGWHFLERRERSALAALAAATGMLLLTGGVSMIYFGVAFVVAVLGPRALAASEWRQRIGAGAALALAGLLGVALAAPALAPVVEHSRISARALGVDEAFATSFAWEGLRFLPSLFWPNFLGQQVRGDYLGGGTQWEIAGYYAGVLPFALALVALVAGARERRGERIAFGVLFVGAVLLALGSSTPLHGFAHRWLPLYGAMRCPPRALYLFTLGIPLLAADGLDVALGWSRRRFGLREGSGAIETSRAIPALLVALVALDLLVTHRAENPSTTLAEARRAAFPDVVPFLEQQRGYRYANDVHLDHALHNSGLLWSHECASGYSSIPIWRYLHLLWIANHGAPYPHARLHDDLSAQGLWRFSSPLVDLLNVRWVIAKEPPDGSGFVERFSGGGERPVKVYENLEVLPRAFVVHRARVVDGEPEAARAVAAADFDPTREVVLERAPVPAPVLPPDGVALRMIAGLQSIEPGELEVEVRLERPGLLMLSLPFHPGWRASLDGAPAPLLAADYALVAVAVPAGSHAVRVEMTSGALDVGLAVGGVAAVALLALTFSRRRRTGS